VPVFDAIEEFFMNGPFSKPPRRDAMALAFGIAFVIFGGFGLLRSAGVRVELEWLYPILFIGLGVAGLVSALSRGRS
jgi:hypothetical protein